jgi:hypothetical protein
MIYIAISYTDSPEKIYEKLNVPGSAPILGQDKARALAAYVMRIVLLISKTLYPLCWPFRALFWFWLGAF